MGLKTQEIKKIRDFRIAKKGKCISTTHTYSLEEYKKLGRGLFIDALQASFRTRLSIQICRRAKKVEITIDQYL